MITNENKKTVTGNVTSELTDGKINSDIMKMAVDEVKDYIKNLSISLFYKEPKITVNDRCNTFHIGIKNEINDGMSIYLMRKMLDGAFAHSRIYWLSVKNNMIVFDFELY